MQEEVENRTIHLAVSTTRLSTRTVVEGIRNYLRYREQKKAGMRINGTAIRGKQSVKQLLGQDQGAANAEIEGEGIKDFERLARKYGVSFAVRKDRSVDPPRYLVFVRAKDADALDAICKEHQARVLSGKQHPSVLKELKKFKRLSAVMPKKIRQKRQERDL